MKRHLLLLVLVMAKVHAQAQDASYNPLYYMGYDYFVTENTMQQRDGDVVTCSYIYNAVPMPLGNLILKMNPATLQITDSVFMSDMETPYFLFAKDPSGEGNIRACFEYVESIDSTFLRISHFPDNDLHVNPYEDVVSPLCEGQVIGYIDSYFIDCRGDLIMKYYKVFPEENYECHIVRFGPDGTLKHEAVLPQSQNFITKMKVFRESPLEYYQWARSLESNLTCYVMDSAFNLKTSTVINKIFNEELLYEGGHLYEYFNFKRSTQVLHDSGDLLIAAEYTSDTNFDPIHSEHGVAVARYDLRTMQKKNLVKFNDLPGANTFAECSGFLNMSDGALYLLYTEYDSNEKQMIHAVKMDPDFNVEWKRYIEFPNGIFMGSSAHCIHAEDNESNEVMVVTGDSYDLVNNYSGIFYFFVTHDGTVGTSESGIEVRPYCFYPNPVQAQLQMQFSPDVQPRQVELYDLQGRLVRTQRSNFGSIDMSRLPAGTYMMRVTLEDGTMYSDKVVKE